VGPRYAIAYSCTDVEFLYDLALLYHLTLAEATELHDLGWCYRRAPVELSGALVGVGPDRRAAVVASRVSTTVGAGGRHFSLPVETDSTDVVARLIPDVPATEPRPTQRLYLARDLVVTAPLVHDIDFDAGGFEPEVCRVDVDGAGGGAAELIQSSLLTEGPFEYAVENNRQDTNVVHTIPAARLTPGDRVRFTRSSVGDGTSRSFSSVLSTPTDVTGAYGPIYAPEAPTVAATAPFVRLAGSLPHVDGADTYEIEGFGLDPTTAVTVQWLQVYTDEYAGAAAIDYEFPDLSGIGGWDVGLPRGVIQWTAAVTTSTSTDRLPTYLDLELVAGDTIIYGDAFGVLEL
jgi:hypothetical protein